MEQTSNECVARALYQALDGRRTHAVAAFLDGVSLLHVAGRSGLAGHYQGREAILGLLCRMGELTEGSLRYGESSMTVDAAGAVVLQGRVAAGRRGRQLDTAAMITLTIADSVLREIRLAYRDQSGFDDFWS